jgi:hypothetical protein
MHEGQAGTSTSGDLSALPFPQRPRQRGIVKKREGRWRSTCRRRTRRAAGRDPCCNPEDGSPVRRSDAAAAWSLTSGSSWSSARSLSAARWILPRAAPRSTPYPRCHYVSGKRTAQIDRALRAGQLPVLCAVRQRAIVSRSCQSGRTQPAYAQPTPAMRTWCSRRPVGRRSR